MKIFKTLLTELAELKIISVSHGDKALQEFSNFYDEERVLHLKQFKEYSEKDQRLDEFFFHDIGIGKYTHLSFVARLDCFRPSRNKILSAKGSLRFWISL